MKVEIKGGEVAPKEFKVGIYKDKDNDLWFFFNEEKDGLCLSHVYLKIRTFDDADKNFGPLTYFTGTVTLAND